MSAILLGADLFFKRGLFMIIFNKKEAYAADEHTINCLGISSEMLMENAGQAICHEILKFANPNDTISVFCGRGNNGGDGIVVARRLKNLNFNVNLVLLEDPSEYQNAALYHMNLYLKHGYDFVKYSSSVENIIQQSTIIVDAMFGIGFRGEISPEYSEVFYKINQSNAKIIAIDIPSGVSADGKVSKNAIRADLTLTISFPKVSAFLYPSKLNYGKILVVDAGIIYDKKSQTQIKQTWSRSDFFSTLSFPAPSANKASNKRALIVSGSDHMPGAAILCAKACFSAGIGLLKLATTQNVKSHITAHLPEATHTKCLEENGTLCDFEIPEKVDIIACGPGISRNFCARNVVKKAILSDLPIVLDADALYFLDSDLLKLLKARKSPSILTPHTGEMARLCGVEAGEIEKNRFEISRQKAIELNCFLVLKGPHTILSTPDGNQFVNQSGNQSLAKAGTGDVLTGIITAFVPSHQSVQQAISNAIYAHGRSADLLVEFEKDTRCVCATNVVENLSSVFKEAQKKDQTILK